jgi:hypothetical protein
MNQRIKKISPASLAAILAAVYFVIGILTGIFGIIGGLSGANVTLNGPFTFSGSGTTVIIISIFYPLISALGGAIMGFLLAIVYNFSTKFTKGLLIQIEESNHYEF